MTTPKGKHPQKTMPRSATPTADRPQSNVSAPHERSRLEKPERPHTASKPPKDVNKQGAHPTSRSAEGSSNVVRTARNKKYIPTSKESGDSHVVLDIPKRQATRTSANCFQDHLSQEDVDKIEQETRGQRDNPQWYNRRQNRITASLAHQISHSRFANEKTKDIPQSYLKAILGSAPSVQTAAMNWGISNEEKAVNAYEKLASVQKGKDVQVESCGLFIHPTKTWLAASPDGIVKDRHTGETLNILEVKCPFKHKEHTIREACKDRNFCLDLSADYFTLKRQHSYYTQVQCQMAVTGISNADFVVHTNKETAVVPVKFDMEFWKDVEPKLEKFYMEAVVPNIKQGVTNKEHEQNKAVYSPEE